MLVCLLVSSGAALAGDTHYNCVIISASQLTEKGTLDSHRSLKSTLGEKFTVDRMTGRVIGGPLDNSQMKIELIDKGSNEMSFQAFAQAQARTHTTHIEIQEFVRSSEKPFVGTTTLYFPGVYSGTCK
jgi:hypothetical protein